MTNKRICPICSKEIVDFLKHLRFIHNVTSPEELAKNIKKINQVEDNKKKFANYVYEIKLKMKKGEISAEQYRELITKWIKDNSKQHANQA